MNVRDIIGGFLIIAFISATGILFFKAIPPSNEQLIAYMLGQLSGFVSAVVALHYVTKAGERELEQTRAENTGAAFKAIEAASQSTPAAEPAPDVTLQPGETAQAAEETKP